MPGSTDIVTGAFGFSGRYIMELLLQSGRKVRTLTGHPNRNSFGGRVEVAPFNFGHPDALVRSLTDIDTVFNTYWIRYPRGELTFERATSNLKALIQAAKAANVRRFIHISITNASAKSPFPYFRGKGIVEDCLRSSGLSYAILRPAIIFGSEDILLHNIAWMLRKFPLFMIPGDGQYHVQPIFAGDLARLAVEKSGEQSSVAIDAVGPETFTFNELVDLLRRIVGSRARILHVSPTAVLLFARLFSVATRDITLTSDEIGGLMADLLVSRGSPTGPTRLTEWLAQNAGEMGSCYSSELARRT